jgi:glycosyltransferase involved in cell wall biosynthesis
MTLGYPAMPTVAIDARDARGTTLRGWGRYTRELVRALQDRDDGEIAYRVLERGAPGPEVAWEQIALPLLLRRERAALVHSPNCFLPLRRPCPGVVTIHDLAFEEYPDDFARLTSEKYRWFTPRAARSAERVICVSAFTRDDVCARYGVDGEKVRVIPNAPALPRGDAPAPGGPYLLAVGDLRAKKNFGRLVAAFVRLRAEGAGGHRLVIAGVDAGQAQALREAAGDAPVELTGYVSDERLDALLRGADALVHPSLYEGYGLVLVEAMARGCPVAAARATALPETAGDAAVYFDPFDVDDIAAAVGRLLSDRSLRERLVARGHERADALSWRRTADDTAAVYGELLGSAGGARRAAA